MSNPWLRHIGGRKHETRNLWNICFISSISSISSLENIKHTYASMEVNFMDLMELMEILNGTGGTPMISMELMELVKCFEDLWGWNLDNELIWCTHWENNAEELIFLWQRVEEIRTSYEARTAEALEISYYKWLSTLVDMGSYGNNMCSICWTKFKSQTASRPVMD